MQKYGHLANAEQSAVESKPCVICGDERPCFSWTDYAGEAYCRRCGTTYQLKWGSDEQMADGRYPYCKAKKEAIPILRRYWEETGKMNGMGWVMLFDEYPEIHQGRMDFSAWWALHEAEYPQFAETAKQKEESDGDGTDSSSN